ncbi:two-component system sensor histidine kinase CreC [Piscinibacter gummiphilus]|uniref:histidine kinase n=1 Tax=Piscinibacter gummiphilus TaxID=946333 RepID=A0A1W6LGE8_9BURK|nr:two-component system sensor histidine kinase CreC [Piscinibacter gummiphilus]ARN23319.1 two-component system sensor histidine kinase CreC [Piscinibacter gummiphilus]ATU68020.1 two-component system sensor histidine kinase CreC [Piscinibacter gummiphilus]GLS97314.1 two-component sensor histidine kinase [Piscinibacter gummiphilus]
MSKRTRIFIGILLAYALGVGWLMYRQLEDIDPRYRESAEESLVETAQLVATLVERQSVDGTLQAEALGPVFQALYARRFEADIFGFRKTRVELRAAVTDRDGRVVFDSLGRETGKDHSQWRDVRLALQGEYGARSTPDIAGDHRTTVMYVAAPIRVNDRIIGVVSVGKPVQSFGQFVEAARRKTVLVGVTSAAAVLLLAVIVSLWLVRPFGVIADYVRYVRSQRSFSLPRLGRRALGAIGAAYDEMRDALAGHSYVADYVQTLTHEVKSPLSAIRGAAELLQEPMPDADRARFAGNIAREALRIQELVDRMMELTALESRRGLDTVAPVALGPMLRDLAAAARHAGAPRGVTVDLDVPPEEDVPSVEGDAFLLQRAVANLLSNAVDFSPNGGTVTLAVKRARHTVAITVRDRGPGVPQYAEGKVFEKFYSLARPGTQKKSTGLGLPFVKEIAELHQGRVTLTNAPDGGAVATLALPSFA